MGQCNSFYFTYSQIIDFIISPVADPPVIDVQNTECNFLSSYTIAFEDPPSPIDLHIRANLTGYFRI